MFISAPENRNFSVEKFVNLKILTLRFLTNSLGISIFSYLIHLNISAFETESCLKHLEKIKSCYGLKDHLRRVESDDLSKYSTVKKSFLIIFMISLDFISFLT